MPITPGVTLTATMKTILGNAALQGYLRITLCGFGPVLPVVPTVCMLGDASIPQKLGPNTTFSQVLWGNDVISPANTFYEIAMLDQDENVIQAGIYQFLNSAGSIDLSAATQIVGPFGFIPLRLNVQPATGAVPGSVYTAPGLPLAVFYNGVLLPYNVASPVLSYTSVAEVVTLNFVTESGDRIDALCIPTF